MGNKWLNGLQVTYEKKDGELRQAESHFSMAGNPQERNFLLTRGEYLRKVEVYEAHHIQAITLITNTREETFGDHADLEEQDMVVLEAPMGSCITAFFGTVGEVLDSIGCYVVRLPLKKGARHKDYSLSGRG